MTKTVVGLYKSVENARDAVKELHEAEFDRKAISLMVVDRSGETSDLMKEDKPDMRPETKGAVGWGALMGGLGGLLVGMALLSLPGIGPVLAAGPIATALAAAGIGAASGGLVGALTAAGLPEEEAEFYAAKVMEGAAMVAVKTEGTDELERAETVLQRFDPIDVGLQAADWYTSQSQQMGSLEAGAPLQGETNLEPGTNRSTLPQNVTFEENESGFRRHFIETYGDNQEAYEEFAREYEFGTLLADDENYRDWDWDDLEPEARSQWERNHPGKVWSDYSSAIRYGWEMKRSG